MSGRWSQAVLLAAALAAAGCGGPTIRRTLECELHGDGSSEVTFEVTFPSTRAADVDEAVRDHVEGVRIEFLEGWDRWAQRFEQAGGREETLRWEKRGGELRRLVRSVSFRRPEELSRFFADTDLTVLFRADPGESEITVFPGEPTRATRDQVERLDELLDEWSEAVVRYLRRVAELYAYLKESRGRATPVFRAIFEDDPGALSEVEEELLERLLEALGEVLDVAGRTEGWPESLEQLARLVYDPFPAVLSVVVHGEVTLIDGFVRLGDGSYQAPPLGLERALAEVEERWVTPPLLTTYERLERLGDNARFDLGDFVATPRRVAALPTAEEVSQSVEEALRPPREFRLRWVPTSAAPGSRDSP